MSTQEGPITPTSTCAVCGGVVGVIENERQGSWWAHEVHPADDHDAEVAEPCPVIVGQQGAFGQFVTCGKPHAVADHEDAKPLNSYRDGEGRSLDLEPPKDWR